MVLRDTTPRLTVWPWFLGLAVALFPAAAAGAAPAPAVAPPPGITVTGLLRGPGPTLAIFRQNGYTYVAGVGDVAGDYRVVAIRPGRIVLRRGAFLYEVPTPVVPTLRPQILPGAVLTLAGIILGRPSLAILRADGISVVAGVGDRVGDATVEAIRRESILIRRGAGVFELPLAGLAFP